MLLSSISLSQTNKSSMISPRYIFAREVISNWIKEIDSKILIVGGGKEDSEIFLQLGFSNVTVSNLDSRMKGDEFKPFQWSYQDAENLDYSDSEFDFVIVHAALHHCQSPHRALLEMYRVAKKGIIAFESRDSFLMRILEKYHFTQTYEHAAVYFNDGKYGGVNNTEIPNYIYRWTEREIEKTISSYSPYTNHIFQYKYSHDLPSTTGLERNNMIKFLVILIGQPLYKFFSLVFPEQQNLFAFYIQKDSVEQNLHPWLIAKEGKIQFNNDWAKAFYK